MIAKVRTSARLQKLARLFHYRKHDVIISDYDAIELSGGFWDEGSRSYYSLYTPPSTLSPIPVCRNPPQFGGAPLQTFEIPAGSYVVEGGIFRGKKSHLHIYGIDAEQYFCGSPARLCGLCRAPLERGRCSVCDSTSVELLHKIRGES